MLFRSLKKKNYYDQFFCSLLLYFLLLQFGRDLELKSTNTTNKKIHKTILSTQKNKMKLIWNVLVKLPDITQNKSY